jgi:hypothetical protein
MVHNAEKVMDDIYRVYRDEGGFFNVNKCTLKAF